MTTKKYAAKRFRIDMKTNPDQPQTRKVRLREVGLKVKEISKNLALAFKLKDPELIIDDNYEVFIEFMLEVPPGSLEKDLDDLIENKMNAVKNNADLLHKALTKVKKEGEKNKPLELPPLSNDELSAALALIKARMQSNVPIKLVGVDGNELIIPQLTRINLNVETEVSRIAIRVISFNWDKMIVVGKTDDNSSIEVGFKVEQMFEFLQGLTKNQMGIITYMKLESIIPIIEKTLCGRFISYEPHERLF